MLMRPILGLAALVLAATACLAQTPERLAVVEDVIETEIVTRYAAFDAATGTLAEAAGAHCQGPSPDSLSALRDQFAATVDAWSRVEMIRFGPAREDYRFERIFFWPDRKGRGLRQVQGFVGAKEPAALDPKTLYEQSVAVQGLPALDFLLFGPYEKRLLAEGSYVCGYVSAVAQSLHVIAGNILSDWRDPDGYRKLMLNPGPENPLFRDDAEVLQAIIQAAREQVQMVRDLKLQAVIEESPDASHAKRAPFWRSNETVPSLIANLEAVAALFEGHFNPLLGTDDGEVANALAFEIRSATHVLRELDETGDSWVALVESPEHHKELTYTLIPLGGAVTVLSDRYPAALALVLGFNSMDGD
ncbi:imelysin family protein [Tepidamorphus sp. 3E244]|uniref:imelysin family protein n=1 Tax=Tepidamorphus sp. 3E244 TaxID=3385498 RepID=UPI0038FCF1B4